MQRLASLILFSALLVATSVAQSQPFEDCCTMDRLEQLIEDDPGIIAEMALIEQHTQGVIQNTPEGMGGTVYRIPTVVHVLWNTPAQDISDTTILAQLQTLSEDFRRQNADAVNTPAAFLGVAADTEIEFCLATTDPNGNPTTGINRVNTSVASFPPDDSMKFTTSGGVDAWSRDDYLNIWVCNLVDPTIPAGFFLAGYAQFPGGPAATDGIVVLYNQFNGGDRTTTHEVGHWLNLRHIWGDGPCGFDDFVADTPESDAPNRGCPSGHVSCGSVDMVENYMDYTDDSCKNILTVGQAARMRALFAPGGFRESLLTSPGCGPAPHLDILDGSFEAQAAGGEPALPWFKVGGGTAHSILPDGAPLTDNAFPTDGGRWCDLQANGSNSATPPSNPGGAGSAPVGGVGITQVFTFPATTSILSFDAAFANAELAPQTTYNDFMSVDVSDGTTTVNVYYADTNSPTPNVSAINGRPMTDVTSVRVDLRDLFVGASTATEFTLTAVVANAGDGSVDSNGYIDDFELSTTTITLVDGATVLEDFENGRGGYEVHFGVWEHGVPSDSFISGAASGTKAWVTDLDSDYPNGANARLVSPLIDCTSLTTDPAVSFKQIFDLEGFYDTVRLEMSIDGGVYFPVGAPGDAGNWYTTDPLLNGPGWNPTSGAAGAWRTATHVLDGAAGHQVKLLFRLVTDVSVTRNGMGIDDVVLASSPGGQAPRAGIATFDMLSPSFGNAVSNNGTGVELGLPGPYAISAQGGVDWLNLYFTGTPDAPFILVAGPVNVGALPILPGEQLDLGTAPTFGDIVLVGSGLDPGFFNSFFRLNSGGTQSIGFGTVSAALSGSETAFQVIYVGGGSLQLSNAVVLSVQ